MSSAVCFGSISTSGLKFGVTGFSQKYSFGILQGLRDARRPLLLAGGLPKQILANFNFHMRQTARLGMDRNGEIRIVADEIWLVVADYQIRIPPQHVEQQAGKAPVAVVQHRGVHLAAHALVNVGHAVLGPQRGGAAPRRSFVEQLAYVLMIGIEDLDPPRELFLIA